MHASPHLVPHMPCNVLTAWAQNAVQWGTYVEQSVLLVQRLSLTLIHTVACSLA